MYCHRICAVDHHTPGAPLLDGAPSSCAWSTAGWCTIIMRLEHCWMVHQYFAVRKRLTLRQRMKCGVVCTSDLSRLSSFVWKSSDNVPVLSLVLTTHNNNVPVLSLVLTTHSDNVSILSLVLTTHSDNVPHCRSHSFLHMYVQPKQCQSSWFYTKRI